MGAIYFPSVTIVVPSPVYGADTSDHLRLKTSDNLADYRRILETLDMLPRGYIQANDVNMIRAVMSNDLSIGSLPWSSGAMDFLRQWRAWELSFSRNKSSFVRDRSGSYMSGVNLTNSNTGRNITILQISHGELE